MGISVRLTGTNELRVKLKKGTDMNAVRTVVHKNGDELNRNMKAQTHEAFVKGYSHGDTARSINTNISDGGLTATVAPTTNYSMYVEYGTRKMEAEPFVKPSFDRQKGKFVSDLQKIMD